jgi:hypothetical protein
MAASAITLASAKRAIENRPAIKIRQKILKPHSRTTGSPPSGPISSSSASSAWPLCSSPRRCLSARCKFLTACSPTNLGAPEPALSEAEGSLALGDLGKQEASPAASAPILAQEMVAPSLRRSCLCRKGGKHELQRRKTRAANFQHVVYALLRNCHQVTARLATIQELCDLWTLERFLRSDPAIGE